MSKLTKLLKSMIDGIEKRGGFCDVVVTGSEIRGEDVVESLKELGRDFHVISDVELSPTRVWVTSTQALSQFLGGGQN